MKNLFKIYYVTENIPFSERHNLTGYFMGESLAQVIKFIEDEWMNPEIMKVRVVRYDILDYKMVDDIKINN